MRQPSRSWPLRSRSVNCALSRNETMVKLVQLRSWPGNCGFGKDSRLRHTIVERIQWWICNHKIKWCRTHRIAQPQDFGCENRGKADFSERKPSGPGKPPTHLWQIYQEWHIWDGLMLQYWASMLQCCASMMRCWGIDAAMFGYWSKYQPTHASDTGPILEYRQPSDTWRTCTGSLHMTQRRRLLICTEIVNMSHY